MMSHERDFFFTLMGDSTVSLHPLPIFLSREAMNGSRVKVSRMSDRTGKKACC